MKQIALLAVTVFITAGVAAQSSKVTSAYYALQAGDLAAAKAALDDAILDEKTGVNPKTWYYYAETYTRIYRQTLDTTIPESQHLVSSDVALERAWKGYSTALRFDPAMKKAAVYEPNWLGVQNGLDIVQKSYHNRGIYYLFDSTDYQRAYQSFQEANKVQELRMIHLETPTDTALVFYRGYSADKSGREEEALGHYKQLLSWKYKFEGLYEQLALYYSRRGMIDEALEVIAVGEPMFPGLLITRLNIYIQSGQLETRLQEFEAATLKEPENASLLYALGTIYSKLMDSAVAHNNTAETELYKTKSVATYENVLKLDPTHHGANYDLGRTYFNEAMRFTEEMNELPRTAPQSEYDRLNGLRLAKLQQALPYLERAHELDPADEHTVRALREAYVRLNMLEKARALD
jgi:Flp pilus assembly protein TadD